MKGVMIMEYPLVPASEVDRRCHLLQKTLQELELGGALIRHRPDLFYYTGTMQDGYLYLPAAGRPLLMVRKSLQRAREEASIKAISRINSPRQLPELLAEYQLPVPEKIGLALDVMPASLYIYLQQILAESTEIVDLSSELRSLRMVKSPWEVERIQAAADILARGFKSLDRVLESGISEMEAAAQLEYILRKEGHHGFIRSRSSNLELFVGQTLSGPNSTLASFFDGPLAGRGPSAALPYGAGKRLLKEGEPILLDYCGQYQGYIADQSRTYALGSLPDDMEAAFQLALHLQELFLEEAEPGGSTSELYARVLEEVRREGMEEYFMGSGQDRARFIGHGVGLELDEYPVITAGLDFKLQEGMVFALEPKFVFPDRGAVGIENTFLVQKTGIKRLTLTPDTLLYL